MLAMRFLPPLRCRRFNSRRENVNSNVVPRTVTALRLSDRARSVARACSSSIATSARPSAGSMNPSVSSLNRFIGLGQSSLAA
jgi:hypothetical protein